MSGGYLIVGTAGHVDHGKTMLTQALTGVDTDRLPEERRRGMTIVPGFVPLDLKSGRRLGLVDVPGHARFVKNMLAGAAGIDLALLVIAADEGIMPQTEEHLTILHLLGIRRGVAAITKCDLAEPDWLALVREEVSALLAPTALREIPIVEVSARTGYHIEALKDLLDREAAAVPPRSPAGLCRMPVDRAFSRAGFGPVVTGTLWAGQIAAEDRLELTPSGAAFRVRGIQVHGEDVSAARAGQRTALNLAGPGAETAKPGDWLAAPGLLREICRLDAALTLLPAAPALGRGARVRLFHGAREVLGRVRLLDRAELAPGGRCLCQLELERPLAPLPGDRLILRSCSPVATIGGAAVLDLSPPRYRAGAPDTMEVLTRKAGRGLREALLDTLERAGAPLTLPALARAAQRAPEETEADLELLLKEHRAVRLAEDGTYCTAAQADRWRGRALALLAEWVGRYPLRPGMPAAALRQRVEEALTARQFAALLERWTAEGAVERRPGGVIAPAGFRPAPDGRQRAELDALAALFAGTPFAPPAWPEAAARLGLDPAQAEEYRLWLLARGELVRAGELFFSAAAPAEAEGVLRTRFSGPFTLAQARDALHTTRRYALALLEYLDARRRTLREEETRRFLPDKPEKA